MLLDWPIYFIDYFAVFFGAIFLAAFFTGALADFRALSTSAASGSTPKALSLGLIALIATGAIAATSAPRI